MGSGYRHYAGLKGSKVLHVGSDTSVYEYQTVSAAVSAAQANDTIVLAPGVHTLSAQVVINKPLRMVGLGGSGASGCKVTCADDLADSMFHIELAAQSAASECHFEGIYFIQADDDFDVFEVDNASIAQTLTVTFKDCDLRVLDAASTGNAIDWNHTTVAQIMHLRVLGSRANQVDCIDIVPGNASDTFVFQGIYMTENGNASAVITSAAAKACILRFIGASCKTALKALTGGHSDQTVVAYGCITESVGATLVTGDLAGNHTETLITP